MQMDKPKQCVLKPKDTEFLNHIQKHKNHKLNYVKKENLAAKYAQHPLTDKNRNLDLNKSSALYDVNKLREKINYCNLIKSHAPVACVTLEQNKNNLFKKPLFVDLTKDENSFKTPSMVDLTKDEKAEDNRKSILKNEKSRKSILELSREGDTNGALKNITIRRKNVSPVTKHTEWIHNL